MNHLLWVAHDLEYAFEFHMVYFFTATLVLAVMLASGAVSVLFRSRKPVLLTGAVLILMCSVFQVCRWQDVNWRLYRAAMHERSSVQQPAR